MSASNSVLLSSKSYLLLKTENRNGKLTTRSNKGEYLFWPTLGSVTVGEVEQAGRLVKFGNNIILIQQNSQYR